MQLNAKTEDVVLYTDGACSRNPGKGGWAAILFYKNRKKVISGSNKLTTNNKMELTAAINGLKLLKSPSNVTVYMDSMYILKGMTNWIHNWKTNDWKSTTKQTIKNVELWKELDIIASKHKVNWVWIKGHSDDKYNEEVNMLARKAIQDIV